MRTGRRSGDNKMAQQQDALFATAFDLVGKVYEAAADGSWSQFLHAMADATDSEGTVLWLHDAADTTARFADSEASFLCNVRIEPEFLRSYEEHYTHTNVLLERIAAVPEGSVLVSSSVVTESKFRDSEFYNDWLRPQGVGYCLGGPVLKRSGAVSMFSMQRPERHGPFRECDLQLLALVMPHLRRACLLHKRLAQIRTQQADALAALELLPAAVWLFDAHGRLVYANAAGRELDARRDGLWLDGLGQPVAADAGEHLKLRRALGCAVAAGLEQVEEIESTLAIRRNASPVPLQVTVYPLKQDAFTQTAAAAMFITDATRTAAASREAARLLYHLTNTEARLAAHLAAGGSLEDYCSANTVTANTARTHLKRVFEKTGTRRQAQLVSLLSH
jgi:DNA-binding CsgD family transcriptional regulator/PAS domain-containing protein